MGKVNGGEEGINGDTAFGVGATDILCTCSQVLLKLQVEREGPDDDRPFRQQIVFLNANYDAPHRFES